MTRAQIRRRLEVQRGNDRAALRARNLAAAVTAGVWAALAFDGEPPAGTARRAVVLRLAQAAASRIGLEDLVPRELELALAAAPTVEVSGDAVSWRRGFIHRLDARAADMDLSQGRTLMRLVAEQDRARGGLFGLAALVLEEPQDAPALDGVVDPATGEGAP